MATNSRSSAHCSAINCSNRQSKRPDLSFFRFPKNKERCQQWVQNTRREDLLNRTPLYLSNNCRLCAEHFEADQFSNRDVKNRLKWNAVPTLFQVPNPPKPMSTPRRPIKRKRADDESTSQGSKAKQRKVTYSVLTDHAYSRLTCDSPSNGSESPEFRTDSLESFTPSPEMCKQTSARKQSKLLRKKRQRTFRPKRKVASLEKSMKEAAKESKSVADLIKGASQFLDEPALSFFASQLRNSTHRRKAKGRRWSYDDKLIALSLYHQSPQAYMFCQHIFTLPSVLSLRRWLSNVEIRPGFPQRVFELLKDKVSCMSEMDKLCIVTFDEMSLRAGLSYNVTADVLEGFEDFGTLGRTENPANHERWREGEEGERECVCERGNPEVRKALLLYLCTKAYSER